MCVASVLWDEVVLLWYLKKKNFKGEFLDVCLPANHFWGQKMKLVGFLSTPVCYSKGWDN